MYSIGHQPPQAKTESQPAGFVNRTPQLARGYSITSITPHRSGALRARCTVVMPPGMRLPGVAIFQADNGRARATPPGKPVVDRNGVQLVDAAHKRRFEPCFGFETKQLEKVWSDRVIEAIERQYPQIFDQISRQT